MMTLTMLKEINFTKPMMVVRTGDKYSAEYSKCPRIYVDEQKVDSKRKLVTHINQIARNWSDGHYTLKAHPREYVQNPSIFFARFELKDGRVSRLFERSPASDIKFSCYRFFKKRK